MKDEECQEKLCIRRARHGHNDQRRKRKWRCLDRRIKRLKAEFNNRARVLDDYWDAVSYVIKDYQ